MAGDLQWQLDNGILSLSGTLDQGTLLPLWSQRQSVCQSLSEIAVGGLIRVDTGGLAILLHLVEASRSQGHKVVLTGMNEKLVMLSRLYNLPESVFPYTH
ncbi:lipid asymmetry maintenance protein MlaB [Mangrovibacter sp. SLW1]